MKEVIACIEKGVKGKWFGRSGKPVHIDARNAVSTRIQMRWACLERTSSLSVHMTRMVLGHIPVLANSVYIVYKNIILYMRSTADFEVDNMLCYVCGV